MTNILFIFQCRNLLQQWHSLFCYYKAEYPIMSFINWKWKKINIENPRSSLHCLHIVQSNNKTNLLLHLGKYITFVFICSTLSNSVSTTTTTQLISGTYRNEFLQTALWEDSIEFWSKSSLCKNGKHNTLQNNSFCTLRKKRKLKLYKYNQC